MRLTSPVPLDPANASIDAYDIAHIVMSMPNVHQLVTLRWGNVSDVDRINYLTAVNTMQIPIDAKTPRISAIQEDNKGNAIERREHLVIRDLDLLPYLVEQNPKEFKNCPAAYRLGRVVAHADYRFRPKGWDWQKANHPYQQANGVSLGAASVPKPVGANVELIELIDSKVKDVLEFHTKPQNCYELVMLATTASHLRKGLAKQLVTWLFPFCDRHQVDFKLLATPMGRPFYANCGFVEEGEGDKRAVVTDMSEWGGNGIHEHVYMVRHPEKRSSG